MATITGEVTIVADTEEEFNDLVSAAIEDPNYTLVSVDEPTRTLVVNLTGA